MTKQTYRFPAPQFCTQHTHSWKATVIIGRGSPAWRTQRFVSSFSATHITPHHSTCSLLQGPTTPANKLAMSRALGAAFLSHQVEQLEKTVSTGPASGNWRARRQAEYHLPMGGRATIGNDNTKRPSAISGFKPGGRKSIEIAEPELGMEQKQGRRSFEGHRVEKDADVVVVDASVLVHALYQVKKWCKDGRQEKIIVPLEGPHQCCGVNHPITDMFHL